jgi:hypothetical protein
VDLRPDRRRLDVGILEHVVQENEIRAVLSEPRAAHRRPCTLGLETGADRELKAVVSPEVPFKIPKSSRISSFSSNSRLILDRFSFADSPEAPMRST